MKVILWLRALKARTMVRIWSQFGEPLWILVNLGFPLLTSFSFALLYKSIGTQNLSGFAILGGIMLSFWGNVLWSMASQFNWDKQEGLFEIYLVSPAPFSAILLGMSIGGIIGTLPSAAIVGFAGYIVFKFPFDASSLPIVVLTFLLTLSSLYSLGMMLSSLYLAYGREAETLNEVIAEPISLLSGLYFPSIGRFSPFPYVVQLAASIIPLTIGMDALRKILFFSQPASFLIYSEIELAGMSVIFGFAALAMLRKLEETGRMDGSITVRIR